MQYFLAGGAVRNLLLGLKPQDYDFVFTGTNEEFVSINPKAVKLGRSMHYLLNGHEFRALTNNDLDQDIAARDFTINALLLSAGGVLHMHEQSLADLQSMTLNPVSKDSFKIDPLRVFRAARFAACYPELKISTNCLELMQECTKSDSFSSIKRERIGQECLKALHGPKPGNFLRILNNSSALNFWFNELKDAENILEEPLKYQQGDVLEHTASVMDEAYLQARDWTEKIALSPKSSNKIILTTVWMALCHDLGKTNSPKETLTQHYEYENRGIKAAIQLAKRIRMPNYLVTAGRLAAKLQMKAGQYQKLRPASRIDLLTEISQYNLLIPLFLLAQADSKQSQLLELAKKELNLILKIHLPPKFENLGSESGHKLREIRARKLAQANIV